MKVRLELALFWWKPPCFSYVNDTALMLNVAKCNLGKVNLKPTRPAVFLINIHEGWPQGFPLPCADESAISAICSSFGIIAVFLNWFTNNLLRSMSQSTPNSMDATLFVADTQVASSLQPNSSSSSQQTFLPILPCFQLCPIVTGFSRHHGPGGESCVCIRTNSSCSLQHCGCLAEDNVKWSVANFGFFISRGCPGFRAHTRHPFWALDQVFHRTRPRLQHLPSQVGQLLLFLPLSPPLLHLSQRLCCSEPVPR